MDASQVAVDEPPARGSPIRLYNTLGRAVAAVPLPIDRPVRMYTCGPTVYRPVHLGNLRSYLLADWLRRLLLARGHDVHHVKNITDVGHMRQELLDRGEDKVLAEALSAGLTPMEIASQYTEAFFRDESRLNILPAQVFPRATDHVARMVDIAAALIARGSAYERDGNVYFRVGHFARYGELGGAVSREGLRQGVRAEADPLKEDARDFALWKAAEPGRQALVWDSPWGPGFPGWHIECTAMATEHLGPQLDIHTGGVDNVFPHHEDERAQSEALTGLVPFAAVWLHGQHLLADGAKMAKATGNAYTLDDLLGLEFEPLAFRYLCLTAHYRSRLDFTFTSLRAAQTGLKRLRAHVVRWGAPAVGQLSPAAEACRARFWEFAADDLALPRCLSETWCLARGPLADLAAPERAALARDFDRLLGLDLGRPPTKRPADPFRGALSSPRQVPAVLAGDPACELSVNLLVQAGESLQATHRCVQSVLAHGAGVQLEVVVVEATGLPGTHSTLEALAQRDPRVRVVWLDHDTGAGAGRNAGLLASRGRVIALIDASVEIVGDALRPLLAELADPSVGAVGPFGLITRDMRHFYEVAPEGCREVDALQNYLLAFRHADVARIGLLDEHYRFYRVLDLDLSYAIRARVGPVVALGPLPVWRHEHTLWAARGEAERDVLSRRNFGYFLKRWDGHRHLLRPEAAAEVQRVEAGGVALHG